jgi:hypothetical protein
MYDFSVRMIRQVIVFDAADLDAESAFWVGVLGGRVFKEDRWHSVIDATGEWRIGVQLAPNHTPPDWPDGIPQQVHLDLHVDDFRAAHMEVVALGARLLRPAADLNAEEGHQVYADPPDTRSALAGDTHLGRYWRNFSRRPLKALRVTQSNLRERHSGTSYLRTSRRDRVQLDRRIRAY